MNEFFRVFAHKTSEIVGSFWAFLIAVLLIGAWVVSGPIFNFSSEWQLVINTGTTIITFLMVFLIQNTQNRDAKSIQIKLDELIRSIRTARNALIDLEDLSDEEIEKYQKEFETMYRKRQLDKKKSS